MGFVALLFLAVGLSMDACAVSICKGLAMKKATITGSPVPHCSFVRLYRIRVLLLIPVSSSTCAGVKLPASAATMAPGV